MRRISYLLLAVAVYVLFFATFLYLIGFVAGLRMLPTSVDHGTTVPAGVAFLIDSALITLFGIQHSVMARPAFKVRWTRVVPKPIERSIYVLAASLTLILLFALWCPIEGTSWRVDAPVGRNVLWMLFAAGWLIVLLSTFLISHFELFGLSQVIGYLRHRHPTRPTLRTPLFYKVVRHPLYAGFFIAFWATPDMSYGHLLLASGMSFFMLIAIHYEERDLLHVFGKKYQDYRAHVGMLMPRLRRSH
jgi:protein-S-isoprenylcysteine O-methyltransferase Ste14